MPYHNTPRTLNGEALDMLPQELARTPKVGKWLEIPSGRFILHLIRKLLQKLLPDGVTERGGFPRLRFTILSRGIRRPY